MSHTVDESKLTGNEECVVCHTKDIKNRKFGYANCSDDHDYICEKCLYGLDKTWKFTVTPHPQNPDCAYMVTDELEHLTDWLENDDSDEGDYEIKVDFGCESLELFINRKLDEREDTNG